MRILIATPLYPPDIGGPATYAKALVDHIPELGGTVDVLSFQDYLHLPRGIRHGVYLWHVLRRGRRADVILAQDPVSVGLPAAIAAWLIRRCLVLRIAGDFAWEQGVQRYGVTDSLDVFAKKRSGYGLPVRILKWVQRYTAARADMLVVPSEYMRSIVAAWGFDNTHINVIPNPVSDVGESAQRDVLRELLGFKGKFIISVGRLVPWKGFAGLIAAMKDVRAQFSDVRLCIVGDGPEAETLQQVVHDHGLDETVTFTGALPRETLLQYIRAADVFALNTSFESFSFQIVEAMAVGTPVVTTHTANLSEFLIHEHNALLHAPDDTAAIARQICRVLRDTALAERLHMNSKKTADQFSAGVVVRDIYTQIERLCMS